MSKHTPGPWRVCGLNVACDKEMVVASCYKDSLESVVVRPKDDDECLANARLIAGAPDGYALAEHIIAMADDSYLEGHPEWLEIVKEARAVTDRVKEGRDNKDPLA